MIGKRFEDIINKIDNIMSIDISKMTPEEVYREIGIRQGTILALRKILDNDLNTIVDDE